jgi:hypothetical protein
MKMEDLRLFMKLSVKAPTTTAEVPAALEALEAKKKEYEEKRDKVGGLNWAGFFGVGARGKASVVGAATSAPPDALLWQSGVLRGAIPDAAPAPSTQTRTRTPGRGRGRRRGGGR